MEKIKKFLYPIGIGLMLVALIAAGFVTVGAIWDNMIMMRVSGSVAALLFATGIAFTIVNNMID